MATRVAINGFGRIGRGFLRASLNNPAIEIIAVNDLTPPATNAHLLKYDSTQGRLDVAVSVTEGGMIVGDKTIKVLAERDPLALPWGELAIDVVIESTGHFTTRDAAAQLIDDRILPAAGGEEINRGRLRQMNAEMPARCNRLHHFGITARGVNDRLGGNAAADQTGSTEATLLDQNCVEPQLATADCRNITAGAGKSPLRSAQCHHHAPHRRLHEPRMPPRRALRRRGTWALYPG